MAESQPNPRVHEFDEIESRGQRLPGYDALRAAGATAAESVVAILSNAGFHKSAPATDL